MKSHMGKVNLGIKLSVLNPSDFLITQNKHSLISPSGPEYLGLKQAEFFCNIFQSGYNSLIVEGLCAVSF